MPMMTKAAVVHADIIYTASLCMTLACLTAAFVEHRHTAVEHADIMYTLSSYTPMSVCMMNKGYLWLTKAAVVSAVAIHTMTECTMAAYHGIR